MTVAVVFPWRSGCPYREELYRWVRGKYETLHPDWELVTGRSDEGLFSRSQAILDGAARTDADVLVVADADVWCDPTEAVDHIEAHGWAVPHLLVHRLSPESTQRLLAGEDWRGLPLSTDNRQDRRPYRGNETGTLVVLRRDVLEAVPPDRRFVGWGQEDEAWAIALRGLHGVPWRGRADLVHGWHPPQPRKSRVTGSDASAALLARYRRVRTAQALRELVDEARCAA